MTPPCPVPRTQTSTLLRDHPGWLTSPDGRVRRAFRSGNTIWTAVCEPVSAGFEPTLGIRLTDDAVDIRMVVDRADPARLIVPDYMVRPLLACGAIHRVRNPDLWDAWIVAGLRQNNRENTAGLMYRTLCQAHGQTVPTPDGPALLPPSPEVLLTLTDGMFTSIGMRHKRQPLRAAAEAYLKHNTDWKDLSPHALLIQLQTVPYVGAWTARAIVSDITNDFSIYPFADYAIRTWGDEFATASKQPRDDTEFARLWHTLNGEQLSMLTLLTMTWGLYHGEPTKLWHSRWWKGRWHGRWIWD